MELLLLRCRLRRNQILKLLLLTLKLCQREIRLSCLECRKLLRTLLHEALAKDTRHRTDCKANPEICLREHDNSSLCIAPHWGMIERGALPQN